MKRNLLNKKKGFLLLFVALLAVSIFASMILDVKLVMMITFSFLLIGSYFIYKEKIGQEFIVAILIELVITSYYSYSYSSFNLLLGKINLFPLISWTFGLVVLREIYERTKVKYKFVFISIVYIVFLFVIEYFGYYFLGIRLNWNYESLFGLGIIHAPTSMKVVYILTGPVYLLITDYLKVK